MAEGNILRESGLLSDRLLKPYQVRPLTPEENSEIKQAATDPKQFELTRKLLSKEEFQPTNLLTIGEKKFFVGKIINTGYLVMFYEDPTTKQLTPRLLYYSESGKGWRSTPGMYGGISKGTGIHYTQETKPHKNILRYIEWALVNGHEARQQGLAPNEDILENYFFLGNIGSVSKPGWYTFDKEITRYDDKGVLGQFQKYRAGRLNSKEVGRDTNLSEEFRNFDFSIPELRAFLPNFGNPPAETDFLKSDGIKLETYTAQLNGRPVEWVMAYDRLGRVWIERIAFLDIEVNSYGVMPEVIDSACLTSKPFEYSEQTSKKDGDYLIWESDRKVDITPLLDNLLPIQKFRKARGIAPYRTPGAIGRLTVENARNFDELKIALAKEIRKKTMSDWKKIGGELGLWRNDHLARIIDNASIFEGLDKLPEISGLKDAIERIGREELKSIRQSSNFDELYKTLDYIGGIRGSRDYFPSWELKVIIDQVRSGKLHAEYVTGSMGLRNVVQNLLKASK